MAAPIGTAVRTVWLLDYPNNLRAVRAAVE